MKTAEEWLKETRDKGWQHIDRHALFQQIQLDAMKEGARRATNHVTSNLPTHHRQLVREAILAAAEQWTEKDL